MEKSTPAQITGMLHLIVRVTIGFAVILAAVMTAFMITLSFITDSWLAGKHESLFENAIIVPLLIAVAGTIPSVLAGFTLMAKNRAALRNPLETAYATLNVSLLALFMVLLFHYDPPRIETSEALVLVPITLLYLASAVAIVRLVKKVQ